MSGRTEHVAWLVLTVTGEWDVLCSCGYAQRFRSQEIANARAVDHVERMTGHNTPVEASA